MRPSLPENVRDVERVLEAHGYTFLRQRGSHRHYRDARGHMETFTLQSGYKVSRQYVDNLVKRLRRRREQQRYEGVTHDPQD